MGLRQHKLARDLATAVRQLASADHPQSFPDAKRRRADGIPAAGRMPGMPGMQGGPGMMPPGRQLRDVEVHRKCALRSAELPG